MNLFVSILVTLGLFAILFFTFCFGMAYQGQLVENAAKTAKPCKLPGGLIIRAEPWNGEQS